MLAELQLGGMPFRVITTNAPTAGPKHGHNMAAISALIGALSRDHWLLLMGDFNAHVGTDSLVHPPDVLRPANRLLHEGTARWSTVGHSYMAQGKGASLIVSWIMCSAITRRSERSMGSSRTQLYWPRTTPDSCLCSPPALPLCCFHHRPRVGGRGVGMLPRQQPADQRTGSPNSSTPAAPSGSGTRRRLQ